MPTHHNRRVGLMLSDLFAHPPYFQQIGHDRADADDIALIIFKLFDKAIFRRKIEQCARSI